MEDNKFPTYRNDLNKTFLEELNYKLWVTKGARFKANKRLLAANDWSNKAIGFLTAYLIIFGLLSVYQVSKVLIINPNIIAFGSTATSILLLAFSQMEFAQDYKIRAQSYLSCALKISSLYNKLRITKTLSTSTSGEKDKIGHEISDKYQSILNKYANHDILDYNKFKVEQWKYYELNIWQRGYIHTTHYIGTLFLYHSLIVVPPLLVIYIVYMHRNF